jgi:hypothetical protein
MKHEKIIVQSNIEFIVVAIKDNVRTIFIQSENASIDLLGYEKIDNYENSINEHRPIVFTSRLKFPKEITGFENENIYKDSFFKIGDVRGSEISFVCRANLSKEDEEEIEYLFEKIAFSLMFSIVNRDVDAVLSYVAHLIAKCSIYDSKNKRRLKKRKYNMVAFTFVYLFVISTFFVVFIVNRFDYISNFLVK